MLSVMDVHITPELNQVSPGINLWEGDYVYTSFRLIYSSKNTKWYFRIRTDYMVSQGNPKYVFNWEN